MTAYRGLTSNRAPRPRRMTWWERKMTRMRRRLALWNGGTWKKRKWRCPHCRTLILPRHDTHRTAAHVQRCYQREIERLADPKMQQLFEMVSKSGLTMNEAVERMKELSAAAYADSVVHGLADLPRANFKAAASLSARGPLVESIKMKVMNAKRHHHEQITITPDEWDELLRQGLIDLPLDHLAQKRMECSALGLRMVVAESVGLERPVPIDGPRRVIE